MAPNPTLLKRAAGQRALDYVESGMKLGLGTGSTAEAFLEVLAARIRSGFPVTGVASSERTAERARVLGIPLAELDDIAPLDLCVDGADEADSDLTLIKGGGGALLREKIVAASAKRMIVVADASKFVGRLGRFPLPVEVTPFGHVTTAARLAMIFFRLGYGKPTIVLRARDGNPVKTDGGNVIYDCALSAIANAAELSSALSAIPGVVEHGLFVKLAHVLIVAREGGVDVMERPA